jgi:hypothetical protein
MGYQAPVRDMQFIFDDVLEVDRYSNLEGFSDATKETRDMILDEAAKFCQDVIAPLNVVGDKQGCKLNPDHTVTVPEGFTEAYHQLVEAGWPLLAADPTYGGQGLPHVVNMAFSEMMSSANMAFGMYPRRRQRRSKGPVSAQTRQRRMGGHDEPNRTPLRNRSWPFAHQSCAASRWQL